MVIQVTSLASGSSYFCSCSFPGCAGLLGPLHASSSVFGASAHALASFTLLSRYRGVSGDGARARRRRGGFQCFPPARGIRRSHGIFWEFASSWNMAERFASIEIGGPGGPRPLRPLDVMQSLAAPSTPPLMLSVLCIWKVEGVLPWILSVSACLSVPSSFAHGASSPFTFVPQNLSVCPRMHGLQWSARALAGI